MINTLITGGCSFTFEDWNWPGYLRKNLNIRLINTAMGSMGNKLISRRVISTLNNVLNTKKPEELLVGIMWSGTDRYHKFLNKYERTEQYISDEELSTGIENPTWAGDKKEKSWLVFNPWHNQTDDSTKFYKEIYHRTELQVQTLESILTTQLFLEKHKIRYFMSTYKNIFDSSEWHFDSNNPELKYLYDNIDFTRFLPVEGMMEWTALRLGAAGFPERWDDHPNEYAHEVFVEEIITPFLKKK